jgi:cell wall-associated NlpC family hydrolase
MRIFSVYISTLMLFFASCNSPKTKTESKDSSSFQTDKTLVKNDIPIAENHVQVFDTNDHTHINTKNATPDELVNYSQTLTGVPYKYACSNPDEGFDCSGFITYVFNHFNIAVPRSSVDFTNMEKEIKVKDAKRGDLILFTGTDSTIRVVGHMGIVTSNTGGELKFIHSTSGKAYSVTTTPLNTYYQGRFMKVLRIFKQNDI